MISIVLQLYALSIHVRKTGVFYLPVVKLFSDQDGTNLLPSKTVTCGTFQTIVTVFFFNVVLTSSNLAIRLGMKDFFKKGTVWM